MKLHATRTVSMPADALRTWLASPASWEALPGVEEVRPEAGEVRLVIRGPRRIQVRLALEATEEGLRAQLVEGDLKVLRVEARVRRTSDTRSEIDLDVELEAPYALPGTLMAELESVTLHRWLDAIG